MFFVGMISKSAPPSEFILSTLDLPPYISLRATGKAHTELASPLSRTYFHVSGMAWPATWVGYELGVSAPH